LVTSSARQIARDNTDVNHLVNELIDLISRLGPLGDAAVKAIVGAAVGSGFTWLVVTRKQNARKRRQVDSLLEDIEDSAGTAATTEDPSSDPRVAVAIKNLERYVDAIESDVEALDKVFKSDEYKLLQATRKAYVGILPAIDAALKLLNRNVELHLERSKTLRSDVTASLNVVDSGISLVESSISHGTLKAQPMPLKVVVERHLMEINATDKVEDLAKELADKCADFVKTVEELTPAEYDPQEYKLRARLALRTRIFFDNIARTLTRVVESLQGFTASKDELVALIVENFEVCRKLAIETRNALPGGLERRIREEWAPAYKEFQRSLDGAIAALNESQRLRDEFLKNSAASDSAHADKENSAHVNEEDSARGKQED